MFSVENLYYILYTNLFTKFNIQVNYFTQFDNLLLENSKFGFLLCDAGNYYQMKLHAIYCYDQEPVQQERLTDLISSPGLNTSNRLRILATSEVSDLVNKFCKENNFLNLYYFYHGFAALDWYNDAKFFANQDYPIKSNYLCLNHLCTHDRSYRLFLVSELVKRNIVKNNQVSLHFFKNNKNLIKNEIFNSRSKLSKKAKKQILETLFPLKKSILVDDNVNGSASAHLGVNEYYLWQSSFFHIVTETVFYYDKLHLTEKIFKPIVARRPFILVGAPKNLEYLRSYGFKTFDKWIDESYDCESNHDKRILMISDQIEKISNLDVKQINIMKSEMQEILNFNYNHFFTTFKHMIVKEFLDNFVKCLVQWNQGRIDDKIFDTNLVDFNNIQKLLINKY